MIKSREIRSFDYVNHPYERVRDALVRNTLEIFRSATRAAASRAHGVASQLRVEIGGIELGTDVEIAVRPHRGTSDRDHIDSADLSRVRMGDRETSAPVPAHVCRVCHLSAGPERDPARLLWPLRATAGSPGQRHGLDRRPSRRGGLRTPVRDRRGGVPEDDDPSRLGTLMVGAGTLLSRGCV